VKFFFPIHHDITCHCLGKGTLPEIMEIDEEHVGSQSLIISKKTIRDDIFVINIISLILLVPFNYQSLV